MDKIKHDLFQIECTLYNPDKFLAIYSEDDISIINECNGTTIFAITSAPFFESIVKLKEFYDSNRLY